LGVVIQGEKRHLIRGEGISTEGEHGNRKPLPLQFTKRKMGLGEKKPPVA